MSLNDKAYSVLLVSASETFTSTILSLLPEAKFEPVHIECGINSAMRDVAEHHYDIAIINSPLKDGTGIRFAIELSASKTTVALLVVRSELYDETYDRVAEHGVYVLPKPTSRPIFTQAIDWLLVTSEMLKKLKKRNISTEEKMQEIRLVNRAKWLLIEKCGMTEPEAHRYIEKQAMDSCVTKITVAEELINKYT